MTRRKPSVGMPMLVTLPNADERERLKYIDTGEGGLEFYFVIPKLWRFGDLDVTDRSACSAGGVYWPPQDVVAYGLGQRTLEEPQMIDGGLLIGSTGESLYSEVLDSLFCPDYKDLTAEGKALYDTLKRLYCDAMVFPKAMLSGDGIFIVTLLDT